MKVRLLGQAGLRVSELCLGTMTFGEARGRWGASRDQARAVFDAYGDAGGNFLDTANTYQDGESERMVGEFVGADRDAWVIATKYSLAEASSSNPNASGNHRRNLLRSIEASLKRLGTDYIDLFWVHAWDGLTRDEEVMRALDDAVRSGKIMYVGFSDAPAWVMSRSDAIAEVRGWSRLAAVQFNYNLVERTPEREIVPMATDLGMAMVVWGGLAGGLLSGKYRKGESAAEGRLSDPMFKGRGLTNENFIIIDTLRAVADELGASPSQVSLAWLRARSPDLIPIIGARTAEQLADNLGCLTVALSDDQRSRLDAVSAVPAGFPSAFLASPAIDALLHGRWKDRLNSPKRGTSHCRNNETS
jgi:aryl-alcohol dehydrogenase-like predicted oxidoreductase